MSETVKYIGKIQKRPRLENETDKEYFERVTGKKWQVYKWEPSNISETIHDNNISYYEAKKGEKGYCCIGNTIYEFLNLIEGDVESSYCHVEKIQDDTYKFDTVFYNGGADLEEMLEGEITDN